MTWHGKWDKVGHFDMKYLCDLILVISLGFPIKHSLGHGVMRAYEHGHTYMHMIGTYGHEYMVE